MIVAFLSLRCPVLVPGPWGVICEIHVEALRLWVASQALGPVEKPRLQETVVAAARLDLVPGVLGAVLIRQFRALALRGLLDLLFARDHAVIAGAVPATDLGGGSRETERGARRPLPLVHVLLSGAGIVREERRAFSGDSRDRACVLAAVILARQQLHVVLGGCSEESDGGAKLILVVQEGGEIRRLHVELRYDGGRVVQPF